MSGFEKIITDKGLEPFGRFYGVYIAEVVEDHDPEDMGRIAIIVPKVNGDKAMWATPFHMFSGKGYGSYQIPIKGDWVYAMFIDGHARRPIWAFGGYAKDEKPEEFKNAWYSGHVSFNGHKFILNDEEGTMFYEGPKGTKVSVDDTNGEVTVEAKKSLTLNIEGVKLQVTDSQLQIGKNSMENLVKGQELVSILKDLANIFSQGGIIPNPLDGGATGVLIPAPTIIPQIEEWKTKLNDFLAKY